MLSSNHILSAAAVTLLLLTSTHSAAVPAKRAERGPVTTTDFADPAIIQEGNTWYAFATHSFFDYTNIHIQIATSPDFESWSVTGNDALPNLPSWVDSSNPHIWAPDVIKLDDGTFFLYFSAPVNTAGNGAYHCIGTATSPNIEGPYTSNSNTPWACPAAQGGAIDPAGFRDSDGTRYVVYKIDANSLGHGGLCGNSVAPIVSTPIMIQRVGADGVTRMGDATQILANDAADGPLVEAPSLMKAADGSYVLFFSSGCFSTTSYDVRYATARSPTGPYVKSAAPLFVTGFDGLFGPGGAGVVPDGVHMAFHAFTSQADVGHRRPMYTATIGVSGDVVSA